MIVLLQELPALPNLERYGFYGLVLSALLTGLAMMWKKLGNREDMLLEMSNHHSEKLMQLTLDTNKALGQLTLAIQQQTTATGELASKLEAVIQLRGRTP